MKTLTALVGVLLLTTFVAFGGRGDKTKSLHTPVGGTPVQLLTPTASDSIKLDPLGGNQQDYNVLGRVSFGVDLKYPEFVSANQKVQVSMFVKQWDVNNNPLPDLHFNLNIDFNHADTSKSKILDRFEFTGAYRVFFRIDTIRVDGTLTNILPKNLFVQTDLFVERYTTLPATPVITNTPELLDIDCNSENDGIKLSWQPLAGAEEYQLEFVHISNYGAGNTVLSASSLAYDFKHNSTRITTSKLCYEMPLIFDRGWLVYRVRPVGVDIANPDHVIMGDWDIAQTTGMIQSIGSNNKKEITTAEAHSKSLNWQYTATYAEQGKRKEVISYFDGTLRSRQAVTKINSEKNVIVGETIYDYQGRPTVQVLPTPVNVPVCSPTDGEPVIQYYDNFNRNMAGNPYSKLDFDVDNGGENEACAAGAGPMNSVSGASQYYSPNNPDQNLQQAYVSDAEGYPFTQVIYTPDNTGRVASQSGVGPDFQIGTNKETRYFYSNPNQVELNRMFGSEVGWASHYQKNMVIDPNGQVSISYIDMAGRVVATALAGESPLNLAPLSMPDFDSISNNYILADGSNQTIDYLSNTVSFSTSFVVTSPTLVGIDYHLITFPLIDSCLDGICVDCIYELELRLQDECGVNLLSDSLQNRLIGSFSRDSLGNLIFASSCPDSLIYSTQNSINLQMGKYTLSKEIRVFEEAVQAYLNLVDSSTCVLTYKDFLDAEMALVDSSLCAITCENCLEELGTLQDFVSNGIGTAQEYYARVDDCRELCEDKKTDCEIYMMTMKVDMSPGGQYAEYRNPSTGAIVLSEPLSILNTFNLLPETGASWRFPKLVTPNGIQAMYVNDNGVRSRILLHEDVNNPGSYLPSPLNAGLVQYDATTNEHYIYPEQLANVLDFVDLFEQSWANSLVKYHPEYCYYESCIQYEDKHAQTDAFSSASFDNLLHNTNTFAAAQANGFLDSNGEPTNWLFPAGGNPQDSIHPWDPFFYYRTDFETSDCNHYAIRFAQRVDQYKYEFGQWYSMAEIAAYTIRCGASLPSSPGADCFNFGQPFNGIMDTSILNNEWAVLKAFYMSAKQEAQKDLANCIAYTDCQRYNGCIGNEDYSPYDILVLMNSYNLGGWGFGSMNPYNFLLNTFFDSSPCSMSRRLYYRNKVKRFPDHGDASQEDANSTAYDLYLQTGQCPVAFTLQHLLSNLASSGNLTSGSYSLNSNSFLSGLFQAQNSFYNPGNIPALTYSATTSANTITANWNDGGTTFATLTLNKDTLPNWNGITTIINLFATGEHTFTAEGVYQDTIIIPLTGELTYFELSGCSFEDECTSNQLALDLSTVFNVLLMDGNFPPASPISLTNYVSSTLGDTINLTSIYLENASNTGSNLMIAPTTSGGLRIYDASASGTNGLYITMNGAPGTYSTQGQFSTMVSTGTYSYEMEYAENLSYPVTISGVMYQIHNVDTIGITAGECDLPTPSNCEGPAFEVLEDFKLLIADALVKYNGIEDIDLYSSIFTTPAIVEVLSLVDTATTSDDYGDTLIIHTSQCDLVLHLEETAYVRFDNISSIGNFELVGDLDNQSGYNHFICVASFNSPSGLIYDTIYGTTCFTMKECKPCSDTASLAVSMVSLGARVGTVEEFDQLFASNIEVRSMIAGTMDSNLMLEELEMSTMAIIYDSITCDSLYTEYLTCVSNFNAQYPYAITPMPFATFMIYKDCGCAVTYCEFLDEIITQNVPFTSLYQFQSFTSYDNACGYNYCTSSYDAYLQVIDDFNTSSTGYQIQNVVSSAFFGASGYCYCLESFIDTLNSITTNNIQFANQNHFDNYVSIARICTPGNINPPVDICKSAYRDYINCSYNFIGNQTTNFDLIIYSNAEFDSLGLCYCADAYCSALDAVLNGLETFHSQGEFDSYILGKLNCNQLPPCTPHPTSGILPTMPVIELENDCIAMQLTLATVNAQNAYNQYIDSLNTITRNKYLDHCLKTQEKLFTNYSDKQHHYMLYYYDLAGNLIKTVPPEGVELLDITSDTDLLNERINADRANGLKTVFTSHRLQTKYEYNSLNQLVAQTSPDMDPMTGFEQTLPNGLNSKLITRKIQMVTETNGYLVGEIGNRGYMYKTQDGGRTWSRITNLVSADLKKIVMIDANIGIAIGEAGTVLKTVDGGQNWDLVISWSTAGMIQNIHDVAAASSTSIMVVGDNSLAARCTNFTSATPTFTLTNTNLSGQVLSVEVQGGNFYCTSYDATAQISRLYKFDGTSSWTEQVNATTLNFLDVDQYEDGKAYASDFEGRIYENSDLGSSSSVWKHRSSNMVDSIPVLRFFEQNQGVSLVEKDGKRTLHRTIDGAQTWSKLSDSTYQMLAVSKDRSVIAAVGKNKRIAIILPYVSGVDQIIEVASPSSGGDFGAVSVTKNASGNVELIVTTNQKVYYTSNALMAQPVWNEFTYSGISGAIKELEAVWITGGLIYGVGVTQTGQAVRLKKESTAHVEVVSSLISGSGIVDVSLGDHAFYLINGSATGLARVGLNAGTSITSAGVQPFVPSTISALGTRLVVASGTGNIGVLNLNSTGTSILSTVNQSKKVYANRINVLVKDESQDKLFGFGNDGLVYHWDATASEFKRIRNQVNGNIYDASLNGTMLYFVGQKGLAKKGILTAYTSITSTDLMLTNGDAVSISLPTTDLKAVAVTTGQRIFIVGDQGTLLYSPMVSGAASTPLSSINQGNLNLSCISKLVGSEQVLIGGDGGHIQRQLGASGLVNHNVFIPGITDVHFKDGSLGAIVAKNYVVRTTNNGGGSWEIGRPQGTQNPTATYKFVWTLSSGQALLFGNSATLKVNTNNNTTVSAFAATNILAVSKGTNPQNIYVVDGTTVKQINLNSFAPSVNLNFTGVANAIHVFTNGDFILVGNNGLYKHYIGGSLAPAPSGLPTSGVNFRDIAFFDNLSGIIVGDNGVFYRNKNQSISSAGFLSNCQYESRNLGLTDPLSVSAAPIYTIELASATTILVGGENPASSSSASYPYVRHIYDEGSRYTNRFYYDRLGRIVVSRNARQESENKYSYTLYDELGRVVEAGEKNENPGVETHFKDIFGTLVNGHFSPVTMDDVRLNSWVSGSGARTQVTRSYYDTTHITGLPSALTSNPSNMRLRIMHVTYEEIRDNDDQTYDHATHYNYDIHGNVKLLVHDNQKMVVTYPSLASQRFKKMEYSYDLLSGNVHRMSVQAGEADQWHHAYTYDADNRIQKVYTNTKNPLVDINHLTQIKQNELAANSDWQNDAQYYYYAHGPLARVEVGQNNLQGVDYYYNLQGWLKGVNSSVLEADNNAGDRTDPGQDSDPSGLNAYFAKDVFGFGLHYYQGDYAAISGATPQALVNNTSHAAVNSSDLYNGNIRYMQTAIRHPETHTQMPMLNAYKYDQLNRLKESRSYESDLSAGIWNPNSYTNAYYNAFTYDAMGNILTQKRHKRDGTQIEDLTYRYHLDNSTSKLVRNRLYHVNDGINALVDSTDIDDMGGFNSNPDSIATANNYEYDAEGRLIRDGQEGIQQIVWRVDGKVKQIIRDTTSLKTNLYFDYDAMGHRIAKHEYTNDSVPMLKKSTYYVLDAQGNQLSIYEHEVDDTETRYFLEERNIYGSSRMGTLKEQIDMVYPEPLPSYGQVGMRHYEFSNHLGNVLAVINDHLAPVDSNSDGDVDSYRVGIEHVFDYSPFGVMLDGRSIEKQYAPIYDTSYIETDSTVYTSNFTTAAWTQPSYDNWKAETSDVSLGITGTTNRLRVESTDLNDGVIRDFATQIGHEYRVTFNVTDAGAGVYFRAYRVNSGIPESSPFATQILSAGASPSVTYSVVLAPNSTGTMRLKFHGGGVFTVDDIIIQDSILTDVHFTNLETPTYVAPKVDLWNYDPSVSKVYNETSAHYFYPGTGVVWSNTFTGMGTGFTYTISLNMLLQGTASSRKAQLYLYNVNSSDQLTGTPVLLGEITASTTFPYTVTLPTTISGNKYAIGWKIVNGASVKLTAFSLSHNFWPSPVQVLPHNFSTPTVVKPSWDGWTINTKTQFLTRVNIGFSNRLRPGVERTYTGIVAGGVYRFTADVNYLSSGGGGIGGFSSGLEAGSSSLITTIQDSIIISSFNSSGVKTVLKRMRYNNATSFLASHTFTAPVGSVSIHVEFVPGNTAAYLGYGYYLDNLRLSRMTGTQIYSSDFVTGTIVSQNTDGWGTNWATSYMNVLTGSPNKLRSSGETPSIQRNFTVVPNNIYKFVYTQSENNSVSFIVEQSPNGTSSWSTLMNTTSTNGTHTRTFTPTQGFVRVKYSGSAAFSLANATLNIVDVDTVYTVLARGGYRYGFQAQEKDDEVKGAGNSVNYTFRMHDPRLGRFFTIDPLSDDYPHYSPYSFSGNKVIAFKELEGAEESPATNQVVYLLPQIAHIHEGEVIGVSLGNISINPDKLGFMGKRAFDNAYYDGRANFSPDPTLYNFKFFTLKKDVNEINGSDDPKDYPGQSSTINTPRRGDGGLDMRFKLRGRQISNNVPTAASRATGYLGLGLAITEMTYNTVEAYSLSSSNATINSQANLAVEAILDYGYALQEGWVPSDYQNPYDMAVITNVLMSGKMSKSDQKFIFRTGGAQEFQKVDFSGTIKFAKELKLKIIAKELKVSSDPVGDLLKKYGSDKPQ